MAFIKKENEIILVLNTKIKLEIIAKNKVFIFLIGHVLQFLVRFVKHTVSYHRELNLVDFISFRNTI